MPRQRRSLRTDGAYYALMVCTDYRLPDSVFSFTHQAEEIEVTKLLNSRSEVCLIQAQRHQEPLLTIHDRLRIIGHAQRWEFVLLGRVSLDAGLVLRPQRPVDLWRITRDIWARVDWPQDLPGTPYVDLATGQCLLLTSTVDRAGWRSVFPSGSPGAPIRRGLRPVWISHRFTPAMPLRGALKMKPDEPYRPGKAYRREIMRSQTARLLARIGALLDVTAEPSSRFRSVSSLQEHRAYLLALRDVVQEARTSGTGLPLAVVQQVAAEGDPEGIRRLPVDRIACWIDDLHSMIAVVESIVLQQRWPRREHLLADVLPLAVVQSTFDSLTSLTTLPLRSSPAAWFGASLRLLTLGVAKRLPHNVVASLSQDFGVAPPPQATTVEFPLNLDMRAGALPLLARPAAQLVFEDNLSPAPGQGYAFFELKRFVSQFAPRTDKRGGGGDIWRIVEPGDIYRMASPVRRFIRHCVYDVMATLLVGPAYAYALTRFCFGEAYQLGGRPPLSSTVEMFPVPTLRERLSLCLHCLEVMGVDCALDFGEAGVLPARGDDTVDNAILKAPLRLYTQAVHSRAVGPVKRALQNGKVVRGTPREILNALWDAVVRRESQVNEVSLFLSLAGFPHGPFWHPAAVID